MNKFIASLIFVVVLCSCEKDKPLQKNNTDSEVSDEISSEKMYSADRIPEKMTIGEKKERFKQLLVPAVRDVYMELMNKHKRVVSALKSGSDLKMISQLKKEYKADSDQDLLARIYPHPVSIVLAQAAMESAWVTFKEFFRPDMGINTVKSAFFKRSGESPNLSLPTSRATFFC